MRSGFIFIVGLTALSGCIQDVGPQGDAIARTAAKGVVNGVVSSRFPGVNAAPYTDCIIDNASAAEILQIGASAATGTNEATTQLVVDVAQRPETLKCMANDQLGAFGLQL